MCVRCFYKLFGVGVSGDTTEDEFLDNDLDRAKFKRRTASQPVIGYGGVTTGPPSLRGRSSSSAVENGRRDFLMVVSHVAF